jgi:prevent-host-death family protein
MHKVGSREFKNRMGRYMKVIRKGQSLLLTERGKPLAEVFPSGPGNKF